MDFVTSDSHAFHTNITKGVSKWPNADDTRDFATAEEMTVAIANNINSVVDYGDTLYHLGDWSFGGYDNVKRFRDMINCSKIVFIYGNHDHHIEKDVKLQKLFHSCDYYKEIYFGNKKTILSHYSFRIWNKSHHGSWHFYGHSHGTLPDDPNALSLDVGIDTEWPGIHKKYFPYTIGELHRIMKLKTWKPVDHHDQNTT